MTRSLAARGLGAAIALTTLVLARPTTDAGSPPTDSVTDDARAPVVAERWYPIGGREPLWSSWTAREGVDDPFVAVPEEVLEHTIARRQTNPDLVVRLAEVSVTFMPNGLELWLCVEDPDWSGAPNTWLFVVRDPNTGAVSPDPAIASAAWMWGEEPRVRFVDLDGDGRDEIAVDQHDHNGTAHDIRMTWFFTVAPDLRLRRDLVQKVRSWESLSERGTGYTRSQLLRSDANGLRLEVWRENWHAGLPRTPLGHADLARDASGRFVPTARTASAPGDERASTPSEVESMARHPMDFGDARRDERR